MLVIQNLREHTSEYIARLQKKHVKDAEALIAKIISLDDERKSLQKNADDRLAQQKQLAAKIGALMKSGDQGEIAKIKSDVSLLKSQSDEFLAQMQGVEKEIESVLVTIPNAPSQQVPDGRTAEDNEIVFSNITTLPELSSTAIPHWELAAKYDLIDFEMGNKVAGAGFPFYKGKGARLQRGLINFFLDKATEAGYKEIQPPIVINADSGFGTGNLPDKEGQMYHIGIDDLYLIPTAEVPVTNMYRDVIVKAEQLPIKLTGYTPCFRREAGSYGKDVRGLNRLHQFDKIEIVQIEHPDRSYATLENMKAYVTELLTALQLPFRILKLCGGDMSFASAQTYDFEVYSAAQKRWLEVSSVSNFESFQANRMKCRFKDSDGKTKLVHTLNGSALALPRIVAALLENNQQAEGILLPEVLHSYTGFKLIN